MGRLWFFFLILAVVVARRGRRSFKDPAVVQSKDDAQSDLDYLVQTMGDCMKNGWNSTIGNNTYPWITDYFDVKIDHFSYSDTATYKMRYFLSNCYYKPGGPIFFYTGNEGGLESFAVNTGIMWDLAPQFNAAVIFAEHRFYGDSMPFKNDSYASIKNLGYLTSEQALADYADFLIKLKTSNNGMKYTYDNSTAVIAFGGSYGGMLAAWMRMKYPHLIAGAWASSAPLLYVENGGIDPGVFDNIATRTFTDAGSNRYILNNWWQAILRLSNSTTGQNFINTHMNLDNRTQVKSVDDGWNLNYYIREGLEYMAMVDYPYPSAFLAPMPGFPVNVASQYMSAPGQNFKDEDLAMMAYNASQVYYNWDGNGAPYCIDYSLCGDQGTAALGTEDALGWPWQECSEIIMMMCSEGQPNDCFWNECTENLTASLANGCNETFLQIGWNTNVWNLRAVETRFGLSLLGHSRIILTQGYLDPWSGGGYTSASPGAYSSYGIYVPSIQGSAHHLDLRTPNTCDPNSIQYLRFQVVHIIQAWIQKDPYDPLFYQLPSWNHADHSDSDCSRITYGYPWGQAYPTQGTPVTTKPNSAFVLLGFTAIITCLVGLL